MQLKNDHIKLEIPSSFYIHTPNITFTSTQSAFTHNFRINDYIYILCEVGNCHLPTYLNRHVHIFVVLQTKLDPPMDMYPFALSLI